LARLAVDTDARINRYAWLQWMAARHQPVAPDQVKLHPVLDLLGVEHVIFRGAPPAGFHPALAGDGYYALRNPSALPRVFVAREAVTVPDEEQRLARLGAPDFDPRAVVYLETSVAVPAQARGQATIIAENPTEMAISYTMETPGVLVIADRWDEGWRARIGGEQVPVLIADHALRGVVLPQGTGVLKLTYEPASFAWGLWLFGLAVLYLAGGVLVDLRRRRAKA
jgi:hypothetical protein